MMQRKSNYSDFDVSLRIVNITLLLRFTKKNVFIKSKEGFTAAALEKGVACRDRNYDGFENFLSDLLTRALLVSNYNCLVIR